MKILTMVAVLSFVSLNQFAFAVERQKPGETEKCAAFSPDAGAKFFWYVPKDRSEVHFFSKPHGDALKTYIIKGDMITSSTETPDFICAHYLRKGKVVATGWLKKSEVERFELVDFGAFDVEESQKNIEKANKVLAALAERIPEIKDWRGTAQDKYGNSIKIWKKGLTWRLNPMGIIGSIGSGNEEEDSFTLVTSGARAVSRAEYRQNPAKMNDVCDIVIVGFNNALLATSGSHCMGSGADHEYPSIFGIYWKQ